MVEVLAATSHWQRGHPLVLTAVRFRSRAADLALLGEGLCHCLPGIVVLVGVLLRW